jgi:superfamily II DNA or RNA helicase
MPVPLRHFQQKLESDIYEAWGAGAINVMPVAATGSGKTVVISKIMYDEPGASIAIAHRQELVSQISIALARNGVRHRIVGAKKGSSLTRIISALQVAELGYSFIDPTAKTGVGGVDTIIRMKDEPWFRQVRLTVQDEGHHVLAENKWGQAAKMFPHARGCFPTATPRRADGKGLGRWADGLVDAMVLAPTMREIIDMGYLTDYRLICPPIPKDFAISQVAVSESTGELNKDQLRMARHNSATLTGDVVEHYLKYAPGKLGVTFEVDVESAGETASAFRAKGVPAELVSAKTPDTLRAQILARFRRREVLQLLNVDLFGEGFDLPAIEVVSFARPTESFALYSQQFGRALRLMIEEYLSKQWDAIGVQARKRAIAESQKPVAIVLDHVGNVIRHNGPPDKHQIWSLERRERRRSKDNDEIPIRVCADCLQCYERVKKCCPYCGFYQEPTQRSAPEYVDGDLMELDAATLAALRKEIKRIDGDFWAPNGMSKEIQGVARENHFKRQDAQRSLRNAIAWWAGVEHARGIDQSESFRRFFFRFGVDVANAQTLGSHDAQELTTKVLTELNKLGIDGTVNAEIYFASQPQT